MKPKKNRLFKRTASLVLMTGIVAAFAVAKAALPSRPPEPADNPTTPEKVTLGRLLFFEKRLSKDGSISCNSCHDVEKGGVDGRRFSLGVGGQLGGRNAPTVLNAAFQTVQFWDGRAATLEDQAKGPLVNPKEMAMPDLAAVEQVVRGIPEYAPLFVKAFGDNSITIDNIARAIAAFERTLITPNSPFDRFENGDATALTELQKKGMVTFNRIGCASCHSGPNFSGSVSTPGIGNYRKFPLITGTAADEKYGFSADLGRFEITNKESDKNVFRIPTLRNVALTAPYFHNGAVDTLEEAVRVMAETQLDQTLAADEVSSIVAFLKALTGDPPK